MNSMESISLKRLERICRMYKSNSDAARALGVAPGSITKMCKRLGIETPSSRHKNEPGKTLRNRKRYREGLYHSSDNRPDFD